MIYNVLAHSIFRYVTSIDKALKSFEYTSEWADLISALGKLNKVYTIYCLEFLSAFLVMGMLCLHFIRSADSTEPHKVSCHTTANEN